MFYLIIVFLVFLTVLLGMVAAQLIRIEKTIMDIAEVVEQDVIGRID